jgi:hypothetical protein
MPPGRHLVNRHLVKMVSTFKGVRGKGARGVAAMG